MNQKLVVFTLIAVTSSGCAHKAAKEVYQYSAAFAPADRGGAMMLSRVAFADSSGRYIAERDKLDIIAPEADLQKSWESAVPFTAKWCLPA